MWIVDTDENYSRVVSFVDEHFVVEFWDGNSSVVSVDIKENVFRVSKVIVKGHNSVGSSVNVNGDCSVRRQFPCAFLNSLIIGN